VECCVRVNGIRTDWFGVYMGVMQGCLIYPLLFSLYLNDLTQVIKDKGFGIDIDGDLLSILLYADDICLMADLQEMLDILNVWCQKWKLQVNYQKTQVVHFRWGPSVECTQFVFHCGDSKISVADKYKYLGLVFSEFLDYGQMAKSVAQAAHRAIGLLVAKCKSHSDMPFTCFSKLHDHLVQPIIDYGAATWGHRNFASIEAVQYRASRFYMGVGCKTPLASLYRETGWKQPQHHIWICVAHQWCRLARMDESWLNWKVFVWSVGKKNWTVNVRFYFRQINMEHILDIE